MKFKFAIFFILLFFSKLTTYAQYTYYKANVIKNDNESFECFIKMENKDNYHKRIIYKTNNKSSEQKLFSDDIQKFTLEIGETYESKEIAIKAKDGKFISKKVLLRKSISGFLSLYEYKSSNSFRYFLQKRNEKLIEVLREDGTAYITINDKTQGNFDKIRDLISDCEEVAVKFNNKYIQDWNRKNIRKMVVEYNECKNEEFTLNYESNKPSSISFGGMFTYPRNPILSNTNGQGFTIFSDIYLKGLGRRTKLTLEGQHLFLRDTSREVGYTNIWLSISYHHFHHKKFDPYLKFGVGTSIYSKIQVIPSNIGPSVILGCGVNYHINDKLYIKGEYTNFNYLRLGVAYRL